MKIPKAIDAKTTHYPPKIFEFTGEWEQVIFPSSNRAAIRNRKTKYIPIYKSSDGEIFLPNWLAFKSCQEIEGIEGIEVR